MAEEKVGKPDVVLFINTEVVKAPSPATIKSKYPSPLMSEVINCPLNWLSKVIFLTAVVLNESDPPEDVFL